MSTLDSDQIPRNSSTEHLLDLMHGLMECKKDADIDNLLYNDDPKSEIFWTLINCNNWTMAKKITVDSIQIRCQMLLFQECISSWQNETQMFVEGLKCCKFFDNYVLPYTGMLKSLFCKGQRQNLTSDDLFKCLRFDLPKSFSKSQAKE